MCEECENLETPPMSYAEKRKLIRATWRPPGRAGRGFTAEAISAAPAASEPQHANASKRQ
jgi:hypothetical protein